MVAPFCAEVVGDLGCIVVGPAPNMALARQLVDEEQFDGAIMDVHIRGERAFSLCELLAAKGIPFVLSSGYGDWALPEKWDDRPRLPKPYTIDEVEAALNALFAPGAG
ncbi:MAG: response regulator [Sphingomicrobium sp.]